MGDNGGIDVAATKLVLDLFPGIVGDCVVVVLAFVVLLRCVLKLVLKHLVVISLFLLILLITWHRVDIIT
jgi:hypothetical protein